MAPTTASPEKVKVAPPQKAGVPATSGVTANPDATMSERFTKMVMREFGAIASGVVTFSDQQQRLAHHMYQKLDATLQEMEKKRLDKNETGKQPIIWANVNMQKLALDSVHRIELGLDALIPNHIWPIPYWNSRGKKYDVDLRIGYIGKDYYRRKMAIDPPKDIRYELVYTTDDLVVFMKSRSNPIETYEFNITKPFDRGVVKGGFAYLDYADQTKNKLILLSLKDFEMAKSAAKSTDFWGGQYVEKMQYKTIVLRATDRLQIDPEKINASFLAVETDDTGDALEVQAQIEERANKGAIIDLTAEQITEGPGSDGPAGEIDATNEKMADLLKENGICVCGDMAAQKLSAWTCPVHGTYQGGKFTAPVSSQPKKGPGF